MAALDAVYALRDGVVAAPVGRVQREALPEGVPGSLHQLLLLLQVPHGGDDWAERQRDRES